MADEVDLTKIEKELTLQNDLKIQELKMYADELLFDNKLTNREYRAYIKTLNGFRE